MSNVTKGARAARPSKAAPLSRAIRLVCSFISRHLDFSSAAGRATSLSHPHDRHSGGDSNGYFGRTAQRVLAGAIRHVKNVVLPQRNILGFESQNFFYV